MIEAVTARFTVWCMRVWVALRVLKGARVWFFGLILRFGSKQESNPLTWYYRCNKRWRHATLALWGRCVANAITIPSSLSPPSQPWSLSPRATIAPPTTMLSHRRLRARAFRFKIQLQDIAERLNKGTIYYNHGQDFDSRALYYFLPKVPRKHFKLESKKNQSINTCSWHMTMHPKQPSTFTMYANVLITQALRTGARRQPHPRLCCRRNMSHQCASSPCLWYNMLVKNVHLQICVILNAQLSTCVVETISSRAV